MKTQSALNNFDEFTMLSAGNMAPYVGFTESEVKMLAKKYHQNYEKVKRWYDGYLLNEHQIYNPRAVVGVMLNGEFKSYWSETASYETIVPLINMDFDGLKSAKQLLDKENHKFQYKEVEHGGRAQKYFSSIEWLLRADMLYLCKLVTDIRFDLDDYARDDFFRAYTTDLSLLMAMKDFSLKQHIIENTLAGNSKGGIFECAVADALHKKGYQLYFYKNEITKKEIDVIIQKDGKVVPIEVKSGNTRANSLKLIMKNNKDISYGYKFIDGNIGTSEEGIITLPLYMIAFFDKVSE